AAGRAAPAAGGAGARRLGYNDQVLRVPVRMIWIASGNNPRTSEEISRRCVPIGLDAQMERPWQRTGFRIPDLKQWTRENRGRLIAAACTLVQAWVVAGRPKGTRILGSFEKWSETLGGILDVAGVPGFLENLEGFYAEVDVDGRPMRGLVSTWIAQFQGREMNTEDLRTLL